MIELNQEQKKLYIAQLEKTKKELLLFFYRLQQV